MRNRNRSFVLRLSDEEWQTLEQKRQKTGYPREVYLRKLIAEGSVREAPPADYPKLLTALSRIGNNLNQIAAVANGTGRISPDVLYAALSQLQRILSNIHRTFQIPDEIRISERTVSELQNIFYETRKVLFGLESQLDSDTVVKYIQTAVRRQASKDNAQEERRRREDLDRNSLEEPIPTYMPFSEEV